MTDKKNSEEYLKGLADGYYIGSTRGTITAYRSIADTLKGQQELLMKMANDEVKRNHNSIPKDMSIPPYWEWIEQRKKEMEVKE